MILFPAQTAWGIIWGNNIAVDPAHWVNCYIIALFCKETLSWGELFYNKHSAFYLRLVIQQHPSSSTL